MGSPDAGVINLPAALLGDDSRRHRRLKSRTTSPFPAPLSKSSNSERGLLDDTGIRNPDRLTIHTTQEKLKFDLGDTLGRVKETFRNYDCPA